MRNGRRVGSRVDEGRDIVFVSELDPLFDFYLAFVICEVGKMHHCRLRIDGFLHVVRGFHNDELDAGAPQLMIEWIAM